ncbi:MAG: 4-hydroxy-3-methylbut-2-enyl diphosphate reductase [Candidatus Sumerlaeia bacterium]|nr:4-hydroxy-3-methylbut-2-enyl diphosphate reductase [Candidatus Sumerlaeia bacterium]
MTQQTADQRYYKSSLGLKKEIEGEVAGDYHSAIVDELRANGQRLDTPAFSVRLAKEFGFCYGVDKAIDMAYEARRKFPDRRLFLTTELIHNPRVNARMREMGIEFLTGDHKCGVAIDDIQPEDVVLIPAFGVSVEELERYKSRGCIIVDTTCGSVVHVWKRVEKYAKDGFTSLIHGKFYHEETIATTSHASNNGGPYIVVRDLPQAELVCGFIRGQRDAREVLDTLKLGLSKGFDPARDLARIGVANQTTMLASESLEIARLVGDAMKDRYGAAALPEHFRSFDTICSATQDRQDAIRTLLDEERIDLMLVVGGYNSSNTNNLVIMGLEKCPTYHISDAAELLSAKELRHKPPKQNDLLLVDGWLPEGHFTLGITAGASTPNRAIGETIERIASFKGMSAADLLAAARQANPA